MNQHVVPRPAGSGAGEQKAFGGVCDQEISSAGFPLVSFSLIRLCLESSLPTGLGRQSLRTPMISVFVFQWLNILAVKKAVEKYEEVAGAKINFEVGRQEGWHPHGWVIPLEWRTRLHPQGVVRTRPPAGAKLVGGKGPGRSTSGYLASKAVVLKVQCGGEHSVHLPLDPLTLVCTCPSLVVAG